MTVLVRNLAVKIDQEGSDLAPLVAKKLRISADRFTIRQVVRKSVDARKGRAPLFLYSLAIDLDPREEQSLLGAAKSPVVPFEPPVFPDIPNVASLSAVIETSNTDDDSSSVVGSPSSEDSSRPVVIGSGPAGLFAAYRLSQAGRPAIVIERGRAVRERSIHWNAFLKEKEPFESESNLLYGEGGAGTYSDGKLYTRVNDPRGPEVLQILADCGAPGEILYDAKPHVGSNLLPSIIRRLRESLIEQGTEFRFDTCMTELHIEDGRVVGMELRTTAGEVSTLACRTVFLGLGHSARDTIRMLHRRGVKMERKPFQIGARVEHPQNVVNAMQYGDAAGHASLPPADYRLVQKLRNGDVFSFCMCPGGEILPSTEKPGFICVNGASRFKRLGDHANSGFVVTLTPDGFGGAASDVLAGINLQERIESRAAGLASHDFGAPALRLTDFLDSRVSADLPETSYPLPLTPARFEEFLPENVFAPLRSGLAGLCDRIPLFRDPEALIVGPESRSSSPIRIPRDPVTYVSTSTAGLYPMGEGAGFAGGILSAAIDGMVCVERFIGIEIEAP